MSRPVAEALWNKFKKKELPPSWDFNKEMPRKEGGGFDKLLPEHKKTQPNPPAQNKDVPKKYKRKWIKLSTIA